MAEDHGSPVLRRLLERQGAAVVDTHARLGDATALVRKEQIVAVMRFLRDDPELAFDMLTDLTCVDYLGQEPRFEIVYHLYSVAKNHRLRVKARVAEQACEIETLCPLWASANWMEREVWDLYGVRFTGHPDLRRILLYEEFQGHPLRKDYPKERRQPLVGPNN
jgi:NADH-quinone oxidoreductase subunit C